MSTGGKKHEDVLRCLSFHRPRDRFEDRGDPIPSQYCRRRGLPFAQRITSCMDEDDSSAQIVCLTLTSLPDTYRLFLVSSLV